MAGWATISPANVTGFAPEAQGGDLLAFRAPPAPSTPSRAEAPWYSPESGLFWFGVVLGATLGLYAVSVHVKAGPAKAGLNL